MPYLLHISCSPQGDNSKSRALAHEFIEEFKASHPGVDVVERDLDKNPIAHLDGETLFAGYLPEEGRSESQVKKHNFRIELANEIINAHAIVISTPMWNWNVPSVLKAYIDQIILIGVLDPYSNKKLNDKAVTILIASGGGYAEGSWHPEWDHETPYLKQVFTILGSTDVEAIRTEYCLAGVVPGMEALIEKKEQSFAESKAATKTRASKQ